MISATLASRPCASSWKPWRSASASALPRSAFREGSSPSLQGFSLRQPGVQGTMNPTSASWRVRRGRARCIEGVRYVFVRFRSAHGGHLGRCGHHRARHCGVHCQGLHGRNEEVNARPFDGVSSGPLRGLFCFPQVARPGRRERRRRAGKTSQPARSNDCP